MTDSFTGRVKASQNGDSGVLYVSGSFAFQLQGDFRAAYEDMAGKVKKLLIDLYDVDYMDSSGLGMLLVMKKYLDGAKVDYEIVRSREQTLDLLNMTHFNQYFRINGNNLRSVASH